MEDFKVLNVCQKIQNNSFALFLPPLIVKIISFYYHREIIVIGRILKEGKEKRLTFDYYTGEEIRNEDGRIFGKLNSDFAVWESTPFGNNDLLFLNSLAKSSNNHFFVLDTMNETLSKYESGGLGGPGCSIITLLDGSVMKMGGNIMMDFSIKFLDRSTNKWSTKTREDGDLITMTSMRMYSSATLLQNGKVLISGGSRGRESMLNSCEIYDPTTFSFVATASLHHPRFLHSSICLPDGNVLIAGGCIVDANFGNVPFEIFSPENETWHLQTSSLKKIWKGVTMALMSHSRILIITETLAHKCVSVYGTCNPSLLYHYDWINDELFLKKTLDVELNNIHAFTVNKFIQ